MLKLRYSPGSPYGRKAAIAARHLKLDQRITLIDSESDADDRVRKLNPLKKIPLLVLEDDSVIFDSPVILEYFDMLAGGGKIIPAETKARFRSLTLQALADGITDAAVLIAYEGRWHEPDCMSAKWMDHQQIKVDEGLNQVEKNIPTGPVCVGQIALVCALDFVEKRNPKPWREGRPKLAAWYQNFITTVPAYQA